MSNEESFSGNDKTVVETLEYKQLGEFRFYSGKGILCLNDETIELSAKKSKH